MADLAAGLNPEGLRDWLAGRRPELNGRFRTAAQRYPKLDPQGVLDLCRELLPALAIEPHPNLPALLDAVFDLILLHAGRGTVTGGSDGGRAPAVGVLLREVFPALRSHLLSLPRTLPGALSNAVENLGPRGSDFARALPALAERLSDAEQLPDAGAVLAWRLGDARLCSAALAAASRLPAAAALAALGVPGWPPAAAPILLDALAADGWRHPAAVFQPATLDELAATPADERLRQLRQAAAAPPLAPPAQWKLAGRVGDFRGFDGDFDVPPVLLDAGAHTSRHRFWARCGPDAFRIDADAFGWVCRPDPAAGYPPLAARAKNCPVPAGATSVLEQLNMTAFTRPDSFRVRVLAPAGRML